MESLPKSDYTKGKLAQTVQVELFDYTQRSLVAGSQQQKLRRDSNAQR